MKNRRYPLLSRLLCLCAGIFTFANAAIALENLSFTVAGGDAALRGELRAASLVQTALNEKRTEPRDLFAAALADYARLLETLYANGHYSGVIRIRIDGTEAAAIPLLSVPTRISNISIAVDPGPPFRFGTVEIAPLAPGTRLPPEFRQGETARSPVIGKAVDAAVTGWRDAGHARVAPATQSIVADHAARRLDARVRLNPGPRVSFGNLVLTTPSAVRANRIRRIAGLPAGQVYSPAALALASDRLRRTGAFSSVSFRESETLGPGNTMDIGLALADEKPRRYGFGAEISSTEGLLLSGYWMHRNLLGGAERFRINGEAANIGGETGGIDYTLGTRLDSPAALGADTTAFALAEFEHLDEPAFQSDRIALGVGVAKRFSDRLEGEAGVTYVYSETDDALGQRRFSLLTFPAAATLDRRDDKLEPSSGYFANLQATPFVGLDGSASGLRGFADARAYRGFGADNRVVLAGRLQFASILGADLTGVHPDFLFYSGGGGTVRGQPYQSLDVDLGGGARTGGRSFIGLSAELRTAISGRIGAVAFVDAGYIGAESLYDGSGEWHSGGGLGLRYKTGVGSIRFDVATPISGGSGAGVQVYLGIGQAF